MECNRHPIDGSVFLQPELSVTSGAMTLFDKPMSFQNFNDAPKATA
jgi:hypothetical protein